MAPARTITTAMALAKIGRGMKKLTIRSGSVAGLVGARAAFEETCEGCRSRHGSRRPRAKARPGGLQRGHEVAGVEPVRAQRGLGEVAREKLFQVQRVLHTR